MDPATRAFLDRINGMHGPGINEMPAEKGRVLLRKLQRASTPIIPADIEDRDVPGGPAGHVTVRFVRPEHSAETLPVALYLHGGGWVIGDRDTHSRIIREIANRADVVVAFVDYSRAPEAKYPVALEESYAAMEYIARHGRDFNVDGSRLAVVGDSVGGNMGPALSLLARQRDGPRIGCQVLLNPVTDAGFDTPSYRQFARGYWLTREAMMWFWDQCIPDKAVRRQPLASPLLATVDQLKGFPPTLVVTGELDILRDEGEAFARRLAEAGVETVAVRFIGAIHDFMMLEALADTPSARGCIDLTCDMLRHTFKTRNG
ncbi:MAG: acetyl esterase [Methanocella sp. PtaU1.Bin125]|nr:MAG: acetyl esterase [Methanocella sp. PtaU1.Bin125]